MAGELRVTRQYAGILAEGAGELRVTRQYTDVLAGGAGNLRVSRQYVEVLVRAPIEVNPSSTLNFSHINAVMHVANDFEPVTATINFTQSVVRAALPFYRHAAHEITFIQTLDVKQPYSFHIQQRLDFVQEEVGYRGVPWAPVEIDHTLVLVSSATRAYDLEVNSTLAFVQEMWRPRSATSTLSLNSVATHGLGVIVTSTLVLAQSIDLSNDLLRSLTHINVVGHALTYYMDSACGRKQYGPFIGESSIPDAPTAPSVDIPIATVDATTTRFKLMYPALAAPTDEIELRAPELDNIDRLASNRINRETRGGKLVVFADPTWPQVQTLITTFVGLTKTEVGNLLAFFVTSLGQEIRLQDWEGREWIGIVTTPNESAIQDGKGGCDDGRWTITFEFEGELIDSHVPGDNLSLTSVAEYVVV